MESMADANAAGQKSAVLSDHFPGISQRQKAFSFQSALWHTMGGNGGVGDAGTCLFTAGVSVYRTSPAPKYHAERAILFGPYARGEATASSDIDLVIVGGAAFDPTDVFRAADELYAATGKAAGVYEPREMNVGTDFYHTILDEGGRIA